ncbi:MAG: hypothetical protein GWN01_08585 [Nitrosopumilaceae archaeon]|nr:hypothetical protein [Nitrosopumilaceae archaeon]NIU00971.1 hypothetical protein [Nitrosopumilaceae archaeon]NIU87736.1 hypothetical protein [Nitrosopumilaceae archaeon]NIX61573.1 hypothetical protein [Nitrosopumilaceae archaeon]
MGCEIKDLKGVSSCGVKLGEVDQVIFFEGVPEFDSIQAVKLYIDLGVGVYPTFDQLENYTPEQAEPNMFEFPSGRSEYIKAGVTSLSLFDKSASEATFGAYETLNKREMSYILIDKQSNFQVANKGTKITPVPMAKGTLKPQFVNGNGVDAVQGVTFTFNRGNVKPADVAVVSAEQAGFQILGLYEPLMQAGVVYGDVTDTTAKVFLYEVNEGVSIENGITGVTVGDLTLTANGASVTPTSFDAASEGDGWYDLVYPSQTTGNKMLLDVDVDGYNWNTVANTQFIIG